MTKRLALLCALTLVAVVPGCGADRAASADTGTIPLTVALGGGTVVSDPTSPTGRAIVQYSTSTATGDKPATTASSRLVVRARGDQCQGAPQMRVLVDGEVVLTASVDAEQWTDYEASTPGPLAAGTLEVQFTNDLFLPPCDRNLYTSTVSYRAEQAPERPVQDLLFDADVERRGLSAYANVIHPERISIVDDPVLGARRKVMQFTVEDGDIGPTANPRAQVETPKTFRDGDEIWIGWSTLFPSSWPDRLPPGGQSWLTLSELYGPPYAGAAPVKLGMRSGARALTWQRNSSHGWDIPWEKGPVLKDRWYDQVMHVRLSRDAGAGYVEYFINTGDGWQQQQLAGQPRLSMATLDGANGGGPNYHKLALYRLRGMFPVMTVYHGEHRVGRTFDAVAPNSYS